jgi:hypothetical protein
MTTAASRMRAVDENVVHTMQRGLPVQQDATLMAAFGISYNTWRKVRAGQPIRSSVADRLEKRVAGIC